jgi:enolase-phosphatase E1
MIQFDGKVILLDIEGTTASVDFVHDVMFPFVTRNLPSFLDATWNEADTRAACERIAQDAGHDSLTAWEKVAGKEGRTLVEEQIAELMRGDVKATGLKAMQGLVWQAGFDSGELVAPIYEDVLPELKRWKARGIDIRIYSSGSIAAQKLFFGHTQHGDVLSHFSGHYDTTIGGKKDSLSYQKIAADIGVTPAEILFVSDLEGELEAARAAGVQVAAAIRPGNKPLSDSASFPRISSFAEIQIP